MYDRMKKDIVRHETLCYELAAKFEQQMKFMLKLTDNIESLKTSAMINDIHLEAYQPLQTASIAFEVGKCLVPPHKIDKFTKKFVNKVVRNLEKNVVSVMNPTVD